MGSASAVSTLAFPISPVMKRDRSLHAQFALTVGHLRVQRCIDASKLQKGTRQLDHLFLQFNIPGRFRKTGGTFRPE